MAMFDANDPDSAKKLREMFGPGQVDQQLRHAIQLCWMILPEGRKTLDELEKEVRRIIDRAFKDLLEDRDAFGLGK